ncbi:MAG: Gfo/Idh/MocA family oxidoreductase [Candidatus Bathyarchaeia archaeon]
MKTIRFGVVGLGWFGEKYVQVLSKLPYVELVAVCSRRLQRAKEVARLYGVKKYYTDWYELAKDPEVDAVGVVTHVPDHKDPVIAAAESGKHVIVEKPIAGNLKDADEMISAARRNNVHFMVGHILRFETRYAQAKQLIDEGRIGKILSIYARRNIPGGFARPHLRYGSPILLDAIHDTDIMLWYLKDRVKSIYATWIQVTDAPNPEITWTLYNFSGGAKGVCETAWFLRTNTPFSIDARMEVIGTEGAIYISCADSGLMINDENGTKNLDTMHWPVMYGEITGALKEELSYFAKCVMMDEEPKIVTPLEAREALKVVLAAEESARKNQLLFLE